MFLRLEPGFGALTAAQWRQLLDSASHPPSTSLADASAGLARRGIRREMPSSPSRSRSVMLSGRADSSCPSGRWRRSGGCVSVRLAARPPRSPPGGASLEGRRRVAGGAGACPPRHERLASAVARYGRSAPTCSDHPVGPLQPGHEFGDLLVFALDPGGEFLPIGQVATKRWPEHSFLREGMGEHRATDLPQQLLALIASGVGKCSSIDCSLAWSLLLPVKDAPSATELVHRLVGKSDMGDSPRMAGPGHRQRIPDVAPSPRSWGHGTTAGCRPAWHGAARAA